MNSLFHRTATTMNVYMFYYCHNLYSNREEHWKQRLFTSTATFQYTSTNYTTGQGHQGNKKNNTHSYSVIWFLCWLKGISLLHLCGIYRFISSFLVSELTVIFKHSCRSAVWEWSMVKKTCETPRKFAKKCLVNKSSHCQVQPPNFLTQYTTSPPLWT